MNDRLREIEGTLARTSERKNTILYKLSKRKAEEERLAQLGVKKIPTNPRGVSDEKVVKYVLFQLKQEIGDKIAKIRNTDLTSLERDGEAAVRAKNDEINTLLARREQWERRLSEIRNKEWTHKHRDKLYFGCAKQLPEAPKTDSEGRKRERGSGADEPQTGSDNDSSAEGSTSGSHLSSIDDTSLAVAGAEERVAQPASQKYLSLITSLGAAETDSALIDEEKLAERKFREEHPLDSTFLSQFRQSSSESVYIPALKALVIPDEQELMARAIEERKIALQKKLAAMRDRVR